jgi:hypothetical protein
MPITISEDLISAAEAARILNVSTRTVMRYRESGMFPYVQYSKRAYLYKRGDITEFLISRYHQAKVYLE